MLGALRRSTTRAYSWYETQLAAKPMLTNVCTTTGIIAIGDMLAQRLQHIARAGEGEAGADLQPPSASASPALSAAGSAAAPAVPTEGPGAGAAHEPSQRPPPQAFQFNTTRSITMSTFAACIYAPYIVTVYRVVGARLGAATTMAKAVLAGTVANLACGAPLNAAVFVWGPWMEHYLDGQPADPGAVTVRKMEHELIPITLVSAAVWIPATAINFRYFPARYRVVFASVVSVGWSCYTSVVVHR